MNFDIKLTYLNWWKQLSAKKKKKCKGNSSTICNKFSSGSRCIQNDYYFVLKSKGSQQKNENVTI